MIKTKFETFIKKYSLGNTLDEVRWTCKDKVLTVNEITADKKLMVHVDMKNFDAFGDVEFLITNTQSLKSKLAPLGDEFVINLTSGDDDVNRVISMEIEDDRNVLIYNTGFDDHLKPKPRLMNIPNYDVEIVLNERFIKDFNKAKSGFNDVNLFTLIMSKKKKKLEMVLGYGGDNHKTDMFVIRLDTIEGKDVINAPASFSANSLKEILSANSEVKDPVLKVSEQGLAFIEFSDEDFNSRYYLVKVPVED